MRYLNLGCGAHFSPNEIWTNLDFSSNNPRVIAHNLLAGIPFGNDSFNFVYHSHVLEHFSKEDGIKLIRECFKVLKPGGVLRVAIPDLEQIATKYLTFLREGLEKPDDPLVRANYEWMLLEMYDQTVRNNVGGNMAKYIYQDEIPNEDFVFERIGEEGRAIRQYYTNSRDKDLGGVSSRAEKPVILKLKELVKKKLTRFLNVDPTVYEIGKFRLGGEIHQWMYDRYSLTNLLKELGGEQILVQNAFSSYVTDWNLYGLDGQDTPRKPDSLYIEAIKK